MQKKILSLVVIFICSTNALLAQITEGTYYLRNRETGLFFSAGNRWGTQATLSETGLDVVVKKVDDKYTIYTRYLEETDKDVESKSYLYVDGDKNAFVDNAKTDFKIDNAGGNYYRISQNGETDYFTAYDNKTVIDFKGDNGGSRYAQWEFLTLNDLKNELGNASYNNPKDATFFISGHGFNRNDNIRNSEWKGSSPTIAGFDNGDNGAKYCAEMFNKTFDVYQELTGLPNGIYSISVQGFYRPGGWDNTSTDRNAIFYADVNGAVEGGETSKPLMHINTYKQTSKLYDDDKEITLDDNKYYVPFSVKGTLTYFTAGHYHDNKLWVEVTNGTLRIGIKKSVTVTYDWTIFDDFRLTYYGPKNVSNPYTGTTATYYIQNVATGEYLQGGEG